MNKFEALIITGRLEVLLSEEKILDEVKVIQKCVIEDDLVNLAISLGKFSAKTHDNEDVCNCIENLIRYGSDFDDDASEEVVDKKRIHISKIGLSTRVTRSLLRKNINTVADILECDLQELFRIRNFAVESVKEVIGKMNEMGFNDWANKISAELETLLKLSKRQIRNFKRN